MRPMLIPALLVILLLTGCGWPRVHKVTIQQGNLVTQDMVDKLRPGMSRSQVAFVLGEPVLRNPFESDRWDYVYTVEIPGRYQERRLLSVYFVDGVLAYFTGDYVPSSEETDAQAHTGTEEAEGDGTG